MVVRDGCTVFRSPAQQHNFNFTYQLENGINGDLPSSGQVCHCILSLYTLYLILLHAYYHDILCLRDQGPCAPLVENKPVAQFKCHWIVEPWLLISCMGLYDNI